ncbi:MAG: hypothetical protein ACOCP8_08550 [archaeon]
MGVIDGDSRLMNNVEVTTVVILEKTDGYTPKYFEVYIDGK